MSEQLVVIDHHHDSDAGVYRLVLGHAVQVDKPVTDEHGEQVFDPAPLLGAGGEVVKDVDGKEVYLQGQPRYETVTEHVPGPNFVWADDDERWQGKSPDEIAAEQRADVKRQLDEHDKFTAAEQEALAARKQLPGSGEAL